MANNALRSIFIIHFLRIALHKVRFNVNKVAQIIFLLSNLHYS